MKHEPLKLKRKKREVTWNDVPLFRDAIPIYEEEDIKSAIEGFVEELKMGFVNKTFTEYELMVFIDEKKKKWFEDVMKDEQ